MHVTRREKKVKRGGDKEIMKNSLLGIGIAVIFVSFSTLLSFPEKAHAYTLTDTFTAIGSWVAPYNISAVDVACWGAGGGGAYSSIGSAVLTPNSIVTVAVGTGNAAGGNGGDGEILWTQSSDGATAGPGGGDAVAGGVVEMPDCMGGEAAAA